MQHDLKTQENINLMHVLLKQIVKKHENDELVSTNVDYILNILKDLGLENKDLQYNYGT